MIAVILIIAGICICFSGRKVIDKLKVIVATIVFFIVFVIILSKYGVDSVFEEDKETTSEDIIKAFVGIAGSIFVFIQIYSFCSN